MTHDSAFPNHRFGIHYFPDTLHYRESDLRAWLPALRSIQARWIVLQAPIAYAIPESFIAGLIAAGIQPILHMPLPINPYQRVEGLEVLFSSYRSWGVRTIVLFDRPNLRQAWPRSYWAYTDLVERFLDQFLPLAEAARTSGLDPVFPPLQPGGDYWDTAFLPAALRGIRRRGYEALLERLAVSAYAWTGNHSLDWGAGGPERWPAARPYFTPAGSQDHRGFHIFDWYLSLVEAALGYPPPLYLLEAGRRFDGITHSPPVEAGRAAEDQLEIAKSLLTGRMPGAQENGEQPEPLPDGLAAACLWLLAAQEDSPHRSQAWFSAPSEPRPQAAAVRQYLAQAPVENGLQDGKGFPGRQGLHALRHYLLLPGWGAQAAGEGFDLVQTFINKFRPVVGFSLEEARQAARVTVVGGRLFFPDEMLEVLWNSGCSVERLEEIDPESSESAESGTELASKAAYGL